MALLNWQLFPESKAVSQKLAESLNVSTIVAQILLNRNVRSLSEAKQFLSPVSTHSLDPVHLQKSAEILEAVILNGQKIFVFGDYDCDGVTSTAMLTDALRKLGAKVEFHIPHRFTEGYGLSQKAIDKVVSGDYGLMVTLDCGISNIKELTYLKAHCQSKVLIFDHHMIPEKLPPAEGILNPKTLPEGHSARDLATVGIVYKFLDYYFTKFNKGIDVTQYLDLVALGTIADIAPLTGENRALTKLGLDKLSSRSRLGIKKMLEVAKFEKPRVSARDVGFTIAPRLNAAGRLAHAEEGVYLLLEEDEKEAEKRALLLQQMNQKRQQIGSMMLTEAETHLKNTGQLPDNKVLVLSGKGWHSGVIGITAAQLVRKYSRPVVMISIDDHIGRGSARTSGDLDIYKLLHDCSDYFENFGGHKQAAGFSILPDKIEAFEKAFIEQGNAQIDEKELISTLVIDGQLSPGSISMEMCKELLELAPFGAGNPEPILYSNEFTAIDFKIVGNGSHLKATFSDLSGKMVIDAIGFGLAPKLELLYKRKVELAFNLSINTWAGNERLQLQLVDIK